MTSSKFHPKPVIPNHTSLQRSLTFSFALPSLARSSDPKERAEDPDFYGYLPDNGHVRLVIFIAMMFNSTCLLLLRAISTSLLLLVNPYLVLAYLSADTGLYILYKFARGDIYYVSAHAPARRSASANEHQREGAPARRGASAKERQRERAPP